MMRSGHSHKNIMEAHAPTMYMYVGWICSTKIVQNNRSPRNTIITHYKQSIVTIQHVVHIHMTRSLFMCINAGLVEAMQKYNATNS